VLAALASSLIDLAEIGDLADLAVMAQINLNGRTHAPGCRMASAKATPARTMTIAELWEAAADWEPCKQCGGGVLGPLSEEQRERAEELITVRRSRAERNLAAQDNAATLAMLDLCSAEEVTAVGVKDIAEQAGISQAAVRGQSAGLTMRLENLA
jgi:pyruvate/2-oxoglutarate dehydrogenase complex dihydrolipoamide acyltransferase (E2) component